MLRTIEKYEILEEIGHGGMATVFRARDTKLDRAVALKVMHPHLRASKEARARFRREAQGVARLRHPRILEIYDYSGEDSEESFIATELLTGPTLKKFADDHPAIPAEIAACFAIEVCRALGAAHEKGIVHRDVKPENILLHEASCVKLTDFGIADMVDSHTMTATGQILGSPGHMAPEQIEGRDCDARTDVFSLGTVLYFLACGRLPFTGRNPHQVLKRIVDGDYADPLRVQPAIGGKMRAIIVRALAHDPAKRHASAAELERDLRGFVAEIGIDDPAATLADYLAEPERVAAELTKQTISACTALGKKARDAGDVPTALDYFGRVLALDNGNAEVLALVESVGRAKRRSRAVAIAAAVVAAIVLPLAGWAAFAGGGEGVGPTSADPAEITPIAAAPDVDAAVAEPEIDASTIVVATAPDPDAGTRVATIGDAGTTRIARVEPRVVVPQTGRREEPQVAPRAVIFRTNPANVRVAIDDGTPFVLTTLTTNRQLTPGTHRIVVTPMPDDACCEVYDREVQIPAGDGPYQLAIRLESQPAILIVHTNVPANVQVGSIVGRANGPIRVPITDPDRSQSFEYVVTADGYRVIRGNVQLTAGGTEPMTVRLEAQERPPG